LSDRGKSHFRANVALGRRRGELGDRLNWSKTGSFEGAAAAALLLLGGHLSTYAGRAVLAEAAWVDRRGGNFVVVAMVVRAGLGGNAGESRCEVDLHLLRVGLDHRLCELALGTAHSVRRVSGTNSLERFGGHGKSIFNTLAVCVGAA
jgi:hypothetical protein